MTIIKTIENMQKKLVNFLSLQNKTETKKKMMKYKA